VVGVVVAGVVFVEPAAEVDAVVLVEPGAVVPLRRDAVALEQPSVESATPTTTVSTQTANHFFICDRSELRPRISVPRSLRPKFSLRVG
jgi:hypothetical protein